MAELPVKKKKGGINGGLLCARDYIPSLNCNPVWEGGGLILMKKQQKETNLP